MVFSKEDVEKATGNLSPDNIIGKGGFGEVYRGLLRCTDVAVKILSKVCTRLIVCMSLLITLYSVG